MKIKDTYYLNIHTDLSVILFTGIIKRLQYQVYSRFEELAAVHVVVICLHHYESLYISIMYIFKSNSIT